MILMQKHNKLLLLKQQKRCKLEKIYIPLHILYLSTKQAKNSLTITSSIIKERNKENTKNPNRKKYVKIEEQSEFSLKISYILGTSRYLH